MRSLFSTLIIIAIALIANVDHANAFEVNPNRHLRGLASQQQGPPQGPPQGQRPPPPSGGNGGDNRQPPQPPALSEECKKLVSEKCSSCSSLTNPSKEFGDCMKKCFDDNSQAFKDAKCAPPSPPPPKPEGGDKPPKPSKECVDLVKGLCNSCESSTSTDEEKKTCFKTCIDTNKTAIEAAGCPVPQGPPPKPEGGNVPEVEGGNEGEEEQ